MFALLQCKARLRIPIEYERLFRGPSQSAACASSMRSEARAYVSCCAGDICRVISSFQRDKATISEAVLESGATQLWSSMFQQMHDGHVATGLDVSCVTTSGPWPDGCSKRNLNQHHPAAEEVKEYRDKNSVQNTSSHKSNLPHCL
jgi:hypothetical protein